MSLDRIWAPSVWVIARGPQAEAGSAKKVVGVYDAALRKLDDVSSNKARRRIVSLIQRRARRNPALDIRQVLKADKRSLEAPG
jgi:hypothetical protein